jgi:hypothetical protein
MVPICIFAPMGGFGHHVRWMALLDDRFQKPGPALTVQEKVDFKRNTQSDSMILSTLIIN